METDKANIQFINNQKTQKISINIIRIKIFLGILTCILFVIMIFPQHLLSEYLYIYMIPIFSAVLSSFLASVLFSSEKYINLRFSGNKSNILIYFVFSFISIITVFIITTILLFFAGILNGTIKIHQLY